jgi:hypothetical protein
MTGLERRLGRLEAVADFRAELPVRFVVFVRPDGTEPPVETATVNGEVWHRAEGETKETFLSRVKAEARPMRPSCAVVGFLE